MQFVDINEFLSKKIATKTVVSIPSTKELQLYKTLLPTHAQY